MARTIMGLYDDFADAQATMNDLLAAGLTHDQVNLIANNSGEKFAPISPAANNALSVSSGVAGGVTEGALFGGVTGLAATLVTFLIPGIGPVLAIGALATTLSAAGIGAIGGGIIGGLAGVGVNEEEAGYYAEGIRRGGTLVTARLEDESMVLEIEAILRRRHPVDITERGEYFRATGYQGFSDSTTHMTREEIAEENTRRGNYSAPNAPTAPPSGVPLAVESSRDFDDPDELAYEDELSGRLTTSSDIWR